MIRSTVLKQNKFSSEAITLITPNANNKIKTKKRRKIMARNYTLSEAVDIIVKGTDMDAITDIGRRFPVLAVKIAGLAAVAGEQFNDFASYIPEHVSANKVNGMIKKAIGEEDSGDADEEAATKPAAKKAEKPAAKKKETEEDADDEAGEVDYSSMTAPELFKECKKRGIKAELKKPAKYYIGLLKKADEEVAEDSDDDWGEEEEEKPAKKPAKAADKKPAKKENKKAADEDEDEDWDI